MPAQNDNSVSTLNEQEWIQAVDGAKLLHHIFWELSERRVKYQKTLHSVEITKWMMANDHGDLKEIADLVFLVTQDKGNN